MGMMGGWAGRWARGGRQRIGCFCRPRRWASTFAARGLGLLLLGLLGLLGLLLVGVLLVMVLLVLLVVAMG